VKLLDTSVAIDHLRGFQPAVDLLYRLTREDVPLAASEVVRFELLSGVRESEIEHLEVFCSTLSWIPVNEDVVRTAGAMARRQRKAHGGIGAVDYLIAATASILGADLLTLNVRHFPMLAGLEAAY
jgi:predicted nucleic acid-binding protein